MWLSIDAAYAGMSWIIPEYRSSQKGIKLADSIVINMAKLGLTGNIGSI